MIKRRAVLAGALAAGASGLSLSKLASAQLLQPASFIHLQDDPASDWLDAILLAVREANIAPPEAARFLAIGHVAGFAAMNGILGRYSDSMGVGHGPAYGDPFVAFHSAANTALSLTMPGSFAGLENRKLARVPSSESKTQGMNWGQHVGHIIGTARQHDGARAVRSMPRYDARVPADFPLKWTPTSDNTNPIPILPGWGEVAPFGVQSIQAHRTSAFPDTREARFWEDVRLIGALGHEHSTIRTTDQAHIAHFWEDGPHSVTPPGHFMKIAQTVLKDRMDEVDLARAMALVAMAVADAGFSAWDSKYAYDILRPETVLRERMVRLPGFEGQNLRPDPAWKSAIPNPRFPAYVSGHSTFGAAGARMTQLLARTDRVAFRLSSPDDHLLPTNHQGKSRAFTSIWDTAVENGLSRLYGGVHWSFDHFAGMESGLGIADEIHRRHFLPRAY